MARVPTTHDRVQATPRPDPGTRGPDLTATGAAFSDLGKAGREFAGRIMVAEKKIDTRRNAVERARAINEYQRYANDESRRLDTEGDWSTEGTVSEYSLNLSTRLEELMSSHVGDEESRLSLMSSLEAIRSNQLDSAASRSVREQRALVQKSLSDDAQGAALEAAEDPSKVRDLFRRMSARVKDMAAALDSGEEVVQERGAHSIIAKGAIETLFRRRDIEGVQVILDDPEARTALGPDEISRYKGRIDKINNEREEIARTAEAQREAVKILLGRDPTPEESARLAGAAPKDPSKMSPSEVISLYEKTTGKPATEDIVLKALDLYGGNSFGTSILGRALDNINSLAPAFGSGLLNEEQERLFMTSVTHYTQSRDVRNPDTGLWEKRRNELPPFVLEAFRRRGITPPQAAASTNARGVNAGSQSPQPGQPGQPQEDFPLATAPTDPDQTIWKRAGLIAGPISALVEGAKRTPIIGEFVGGEATVQARNFVDTLRRDLTRVLQNNPRYAEGERQAIEKDIQISPEIWDTRGALESRMVGIDQALEIRANNAARTANSSNVGQQERIAALNVYNALINFRAHFGVPPRYKSPEEVKKAISERKLRSGDQFIDPQGVVRDIP